MIALRPRHLGAPVVLWALLAGLAAAQQTVPDIWGIGAGPSAPQMSDPTPQLGDPAAERRVDLNVQLDGARKQGFVLPADPDLSAYSDQTLTELQGRMAAQSDPCRKALEMALYLDAHIDEAQWLERLKAIDNPVEMFGRMLRKAYVAEGLGDDALGKLAEKFPQMGYVDKGLKVVETLPLINEHNIGSVAVREGGWTYDIWARSQGWDAAKIKEVQGSLLAQRGTSAVRITELTAALQRAEAEAEAAHSARLKAAAKVQQDGLDALEVQARTLAWADDNPVWSTRRAALLNAYKAVEYESLKQLEKQTLAALERFETETRAEELKVAQAEVQFAALSNYVLPAARGECDKIGKSGILDAVAPAAAPAPAEDTRTPEEKIVGSIVALPHDKLIPTLAALGVPTSEEFLNCLCHSAGYGSPGTAQFYHPDTLGTYDKRYSCQHPGDPCIVSGYGCLRYPLPSDPGVWESCGAQHAPPGSVGVTEAIVSQMAKRAKP